MSLTSRRNGTGRVYVRRFDHEEAAKRYAAGERVVDLAAEYGVSITAIYRVVTPGAKARDVESARRWRTGTCEECGGPAMRIISSKKEHNPDGRCLCQACRGRASREGVRLDAAGHVAAIQCQLLDCANGERWQPPENFGRGARYRDLREGGFHKNCRSCATALKRLYRATHADYNRRQNAARMHRYHACRGSNPEDVSPDGRAEAC